MLAGFFRWRFAVGMPFHERAYFFTKVIHADRQRYFMCITAMQAMEDVIPKRQVIGVFVVFSHLVASLAYAQSRFGGIRFQYWFRRLIPYRNPVRRNKAPACLFLDSLDNRQSRSPR